MQVALHIMDAETASQSRFRRASLRAYGCSLQVRPIATVAYEHMFPHANRTKLAQRALDAMRVARSFLLLEDDYEVDWEVGQGEPSHASHPHRAPLRRGYAQRRAGNVPARPQACLCPVGRPQPDTNRVRLRLSTTNAGRGRKTGACAH
jgi:hypothetical protein